MDPVGCGKPGVTPSPAPAFWRRGSPALVGWFASLAVVAALLVAVLGVACAGATDGGPTHSGITDDAVLFGQSAVFSGPSQDLGRDMRLGIRAAFHEANQRGGVHGRELQLKTLDDSYETDYAIHTTKWLIEKVQVFALIGAVGTPTSSVASPIAHDADVPFVAAFTGAEFLRDAALDNVVNIRASYFQETEEMVARLTDDLGVTRVAALYQDDAYGQNGLVGVRLALERRGLEPVGAWPYQRNSAEVRRAASHIVEADPEAVIMIGAPEPVAATVELVRREIDPILMTVSFGGGNSLARALGSDGAGVYVTQVVPSPDDPSVPVVARYQAALSRYDPQAEPGFVSLEGYLAGRLAVFGVDACGRQLTRQCFLNALRASGIIDIDGFQLKYGIHDNQGSDTVYLTVIGEDGRYHQVDRLGAGY